MRRSLTEFKTQSYGWKKLAEYWSRPRTIWGWTTEVVRCFAGLFFLTLSVLMSAFILESSRHAPSAVFPLFFSATVTMLIGRNIFTLHPFWKRPEWVELKVELYYQGLSLAIIWAGGFLAFATAGVVSRFYGTWVFWSGVPFMFVATLLLAAGFLPILQFKYSKPTTEKAPVALV